jgi:fructosamine-3-kinase
MEKFERPHKSIFVNEPKLSEHEVQSEFNEKRRSLVPLVRDFISTHERFKNKEVSVTFAHKGVSSLISIIEVDGEKSVLKIPLGADHSRGEGQFLKVWEEAGVKVPHVLEEGMLGEHSYILMEYIDAPSIAEQYGGKGFIKEEMYLEVADTLRMMHEPRGEGYGRVVGSKGEYAEFKELLLREDMQKMITYAKEHKLLGDEHGSLSLACEILIEHAARENKSSYCHDDFSTSNIFATHPITVFDPNPRFNNRYLDLGRTLLISIANGIAFPEQFIAGYFKGEPYDKRALHAAILINACMKFHYWNQVKKEKEIQKTQAYLIENKHLLER